MHNTATAEKIVEAASALWSDKGFEQATMRELARRLGMGVSSLYFYFKSKEEIVLFLYKKLNKQAIDEFRSSDEGEKNLALNLSRYMKIKLAILGPHRSCLVALVRETVDPSSRLSPLSADSDLTREMNLELLADIVARSAAVNKNQVADTAKALWLANLGVLLYWLHDRSPEYRNTYTLIEKTANMVGFLPMLSKMPGAESTFRLFSDLLQQSGDETSVTCATTGGESAIPSREFDVVVIGGGPIGIVYACFLKANRPRTRVLVLERLPEPGHKIGESTLSGFCRAMRSLGIRKEAMQSLFYPKNGLGFFWVDEATKRLTDAPEYILETFDETYQVERRVLDSLLIANARRLGVEVVQGAGVDLKRSSITASGSIISYSIGKKEFRVRCFLTVDATGPAGILSREFGLWTSEGLPFQTSAVWGYFQGIRPLASYTGWRRQSQFPRDQYTQHVCLREGWMWYIPVVSWQGSPTTNLSRGLDACLRSARAMPTRDKLAEEFGCPSTDIVSVGLVVRSDRDEWMKNDPREAFEHYMRKYPAMRQVLDGAHQIEDPYGTGQTFMQRLSFRGYARRVAGDGWLLVGDAAFFVDPLISPGLTGGTACAYQAAMESIKALEQNRFGREMFTDYEAFVHKLHEALERDNQLVYMSFNHPETLALIQRFQEIDARRQFIETKSSEYSVADTNVWGILNPAYLDYQKKAWEIMRQSEIGNAEVSIDEQSSKDYDSALKELQSLLYEYVDSHVDLTPYVRANTAVSR